VDAALAHAGYTESLGLLVGEDATRERVLAALGSLESLDPSALIVIYYVGHGLLSTSGDDLYLGVADQPIGPDTGVAVKTVLATALKPFDPRYRKSPRIILVIESCFSGGAAVFRSGFESVFSDRPTDFSRLAFISSSRSVEESRPLPGDDVSAFGKFFADALEGDWPCADKTPEGALTVMEIATYVHERLQSVRRQIGGQMEPDFLDRGHFSTLAYRPDRVATRDGYRAAIQGFYEVDVTLTSDAGTQVVGTLTIDGNTVAKCTATCRVLTDSPELAALSVEATRVRSRVVLVQQCATLPFGQPWCVSVPQAQRVTETVSSEVRAPQVTPLGATRGEWTLPVDGGTVRLAIR